MGRMSKVDIIRHSIEYIQKLQNMVELAQNSDNRESNSPTYQNTDNPYNISNLPFQQENNYYPHPHPLDYISQSSSLQSSNQEHPTPYSMSSNVPVSPSFSVTSSSSAFSSLSLSSVSSPPSSTPSTTDQNFLCENLLDE